MGNNQSMNSIEIVFLNFNTDRRLFSPLYEPWNYYRPENRIPDISKKIIELLKCNIIVILCEITQDVQEKFVKLVLENNKFQHVSGGYNLSMFAYKFSVFMPETVEINNVSNFAFTNEGMIENIKHYEFQFIPDNVRPKDDKTRKETKWYMDITQDELFEKGALCIQFKFRDNEFYLVTTHLGLRNASRIKQTKKLLKWINYNIPKDSKIIIVGDFNSFDEVNDGTYMEQMNLMSDYMNLLDFSISTFKPYPYDINFLFKNEEDKILYNKIITDAKTNKITPEMIETFKNLCSTAELKPQKPATLDNIFISGFQKNEHVCSIHPNSSDHYALYSKIML